VDEKGRIRIDDLEMNDTVQSEIAKLWDAAETETLADIGDLHGYKQDFLNLFGFGFDGVDYKKETNEMISVKSIA
jgi:enoyl-[acyl-carrier protein] reductase/trans-2-enoyl-CoA reductase (NAD+)